MIRRRQPLECTPWEKVGPFTSATHPQEAADRLQAEGVAQRQGTGTTVFYREVAVVLDWNAAGALLSVRVDRRSPFVVRLNSVALLGKPLPVARRLQRHGYELLRDRQHPERYLVDGAGVILSTDLRGRADFVHVRLAQPEG